MVTKALLLSNHTPSPCFPPFTDPIATRPTPIRLDRQSQRNLIAPAVPICVTCLSPEETQPRVPRTVNKIAPADSASTKEQDRGVRRVGEVV